MYSSHLDPHQIMKLPDCKVNEEQRTVSRDVAHHIVWASWSLLHILCLAMFTSTHCVLMKYSWLTNECSNSWLLTVTELPPLASRRRSVTMKLVVWLVLGLEGLGFCVPLIAFLLLRYLCRSNNSSKELFFWC